MDDLTYRRIVLPDTDVMPKLHTAIKDGEHQIFADGMLIDTVPVGVAFSLVWRGVTLNMPA